MSPAPLCSAGRRLYLCMERASAREWGLFLVPPPNVELTQHARRMTLFCLGPSLAKRVRTLDVAVGPQQQLQPTASALSAAAAAAAAAAQNGPNPLDALPFDLRAPMFQASSRLGAGFGSKTVVSDWLAAGMAKARWGGDGSGGGGGGGAGGGSTRTLTVGVVVTAP